MTRARCFALLFNFFVLVPAGAQAGPWVKAPGSAYVKVSGSSFSTDQVIDASGKHTTTPWSYSNQSLTTYMDLGIAPRLGFNLSLPVHMAENSYEALRYQRTGLGDLGLGLNLAVFRGRCPVSLELGASIPLYEGVIPSDAEVSGGSATSDPSERYLPMLGDGAKELHPGVSIGCSLYPIPVWTTAKVAYGLRTNGFGDGVRSSFGVGGFVWADRLAVMGGVDMVQRLSSDHERPTKSYMSVYAGLLAKIGMGFSVETSLSHIPAGVFVAKGTTFNLGISYDGRLFPDPYTSP